MAVNLRGDFMIIRNCVSYNNWAEGIGAGKYGNDITIEDNVCYDNYAVMGVYVDHAQDVLIQRNIIYQSTDTTFYRGGEPSEGIGINNETDLTSNYNSGIAVINNLIAGCKWNIGLWAQGDLYGTDDLLVAHNTCIEGTQGGMRVSDANSINHTNVRFKNNIFYQTAGVCVAIASPPGITFTSNLWFSQTPVDVNAQDAGDVITDPILTLGGSFAPGALTSTHFEVGGGSSAIGTATEDADSPLFDYFGTTRSDDDMGAHEFVGAAIKYGAATLSGIGSLAAGAMIIVYAATSLDGVGSLTAIGVIVGGDVYIYGAATLGGVGTLTATGIVLGVEVYASTTLSGVGSLIATPEGGTLPWVDLYLELFEAPETCLGVTLFETGTRELTLTEKDERVLTMEVL